MRDAAPASWLRELERVARQFGAEAATRKGELLGRLARRRLANASQVVRLHEILCFLRSCPDDATVLEQVETMLEGFDRRSDVRRHRRALAGSGISGTDLKLGFYAPMARWVAERWGDRLQIDWRGFDAADLLVDRLYMLALDAETPGLDHAHLTARQWIERMRRPDESDGAFLVRRFASARWPSHVRDVLFDELQVPLVLRGGPDTPSRTRARLAGGRITWQEEPLLGSRPDLAIEVQRPPRGVRRLRPAEGRAVIALTQEAMVLRDRALDAFSGADPDDVLMVDCGGGFEFAVMGVQPEWRQLLEAVHGWLMLRNRVPVGYVLTSEFLNSAEVAYNVFDTWRGGEAAWVYGRVLATTRALFGTSTFTVYPYQLGHENEEGLRSGAWWFYQKLGFRPRDPAALAVMERELVSMRNNPRHRSSRATLEKLARVNVYYDVGRRHEPVIGTFRFDRVGLAVTDFLARRFGSDRERGEQVCAEEAAGLLDQRDWHRLPPAVRRAWLKWGPLVLVLPGVAAWSPAERRALAAVIRAKGGPRESEYLRRFDAHAKLGRALVRLSNRPDGRGAAR